MPPETGSKTADASASGLEEQAKKDETKTEKAKGSPLKKGEERVRERAVAANGDGPVADPDQAPETSKGTKQ